MVWCSEFAEIDAIIKSKHSGLIKGFLTTKEDFLRKPYGYDVEKFPCPCIFAGTVNPKNFLDDSEGNRRFWPIGLPDGHLIDLALVEKERLGIFHSALLAYESGAKWWPQSEKEKEAIAKYRRQFFDSDAWDDVIAKYLVNKNEVSIMEILTSCLGFTEKECKRSEQNRVTRILTAQGFTVDSRRTNEVTGEYQRVKVRAIPKDLLKNSGNSGQCGQTLTQQALTKGGCGQDAVSSGHDHNNRITTPDHMAENSSQSEFDRIDRINSQNQKNIGGDFSKEISAKSRFMERNGHHLGSGVIVMDFEGVIYRIVGEKLIDSWPTVIHNSDQRFQLPDASIFMVLED